MNSRNLSEKGFCDWFPLKNLALSNLPKDQGIIIALANKDLTDKVESDILYIGRTKKPVKRLLGGYLAGYGGKSTRKINQWLFDGGYLDKVTVSWASTSNPRVAQEELLAKFKQENGHLPLWNQSKGRIKAKPAKVPSPVAKAGPIAAVKKEELGAPKVIKPFSPKAPILKDRAVPPTLKKEEAITQLPENPKPTSSGI